MASNSVLSLSLSVALAAGTFLGLIRLDSRVQLARAREAGGATRGAFLDRAGQPIAAPIDSPSGVLSFRYSIPDATAVLGYADPKGGLHGLQARFAPTIGPRVPSTWLQRFWMHLQGSSAVGENVRLTLDSTLQSVAYHALGGKPGAVVALDPRSGQILALVSTPVCSPTMLATARGLQSCRNDRRRPLLNRVTERPIPPGSAFKAVTLTAALDTGRFRLDDVFSGADVFGPSPYFNNSLYPSNITRTDLTAITLEQALAFSDNFTFAHVGLTLGAPTLLRYARLFGMDAAIPFELPAAKSTVAHGRSGLSDSETAQASFGASVDRTTPLQMALIASAIANDGVLMRPQLVRDVETKTGTILAPHPARVWRRVMRPSTAASMKEAMTFVVQLGSGYRAQIGGVDVAGKTGTADSGFTKPNAWFIAFAPAQHPVIALAVLRERSGEGADYAAPIAREVIVAALREHGMKVR